MNAAGHRDDCVRYLNERTARIEYRFPRYAAVADELYAYGLNDNALLCDLGAGWGDFDFYLRAVRGFKGRYLPVDGALDGTDLNRWAPSVSFDFVTAMEIIEHLNNPRDFLERVMARTTRCLVLTTPNTDVLGEETVRTMDKTHISPVSASLFREYGMRVKECSFFGTPRDSILAVRYFNHRGGS